MKINYLSSVERSATMIAHSTETGISDMWYIINVSQNGRHLFRTSKESATTEKQATELVVMFRTKFLESEGYKVICRKYTAYETQTEF